LSSAFGSVILGSPPPSPLLVASRSLNPAGAASGSADYEERPAEPSDVLVEPSMEEAISVDPD